MDLSLRDLAERSGVSAPMLSQVERGETSPTLAVAERIASGLELRLSQLLRLDEAGTVVGRARATSAAAAAPAATATRCSRRRCPGLRAEVSLHTLAPGRRHRRPRRPADARARRRETAVVEPGALDLLVDGARHTARRGRRRDLRRRPARTTSRTPERRRPSC